MKKYELIRSDFIKEKKLKIVKISNYKDYINHKKDIICLIDYFNQEYKWDNMFDIDEVNKRILDNQFLFLLFYDVNPIGYVFFREIDKKTCFGYNLYVTKKINRPKDSAYQFYHIASDTMLDTYDKIKVEIEDWNNVVFDIVEKIGYKNTK